MIYAKKRKLKIFHLNGISANFCCFIIGDLSPLLPEPVSFDSKILLLVQYKSSCIRSCLHHSDWRIIFQMLVSSPTKMICEYEYEQYSNLRHTIGSNDARILISDEKPWNFLHVRLQRYFGQMFCGSNKLIYVC